MRTNQSMPRAQIIPKIAYPDVSAATEWLCKAFGFSVRLRIGNHRAQLELGSGAVIVRAGTPASETCSAHSIMVRAESVDEHYWRVYSESVQDVRPGEWGGELAGPA
ncbi:MAG: hypothetical protein ACREST_02930 [Steroidobacteraceae bacterium]